MGLALWDRFQRWRASKGYGVHSPLAFSLVRNVVSPQRDVAYYGEERLRESFLSNGCSPALFRRACLLLRFVAERQPAYVWISPNLPDIFIEAVRLAGCVVRIYDGAIFPGEVFNADMIVLNGARLTKRELARFFRPGKSLIGFDLKPAFMKTTEGALPGGVVLEGMESLLAVATADPAIHRYGIMRF